MKTILLATDGSPSAQKAAETALELARTTGSDLQIVTAWSIPVSAFGYGMIQMPELAESEEASAQHAVDQAVTAAAAEGVAATPILRHGNAVDVICEVAREGDAGMIVIGAHGWGSFKRLVFGSVSAGVLHNAPCPVLVVRGLSRAEEDAEAVGVGAQTA